MSDSWIQTYSGLRFDFINPHPSMIDIKDIAHSLANQCRFNGHCKEFYSVAEHSVHVATLVSKTNPELLMEALLHDAAEAYIGDMVSPLKAILPEYKVIERRVEETIAARFGLQFPFHPVIKQADQQLLVDEKNQLHLHPNNYEWYVEKAFNPDFGRRFTKLAPVGAEALFLHCFRRATQARAIQDTREY